MNTKLFKKFIEELREQGIKVERLNLSQVSESIKLYKVLNQQEGITLLNLSLEQQDKLLNEIVKLEMFTYPSQGNEFWDKEETRQTLKEYREEFKKSERLLMSLLDDEGKKELRKLIFSLDYINQTEKENSFNNGVRSGLTNLSFLKDYFSTFQEVWSMKEEIIELIKALDQEKHRKELSIIYYFLKEMLSQGLSL